MSESQKAKPVKSIKNVMEDLGFNSKSKPSVKAAFIKHLAKAAYGVEIKIPPLFDPENANHNIDSILPQPTAKNLPLQLELALDVVNEKESC